VTAEWSPVSIRLEHLTWPEVGEALEHGWTTVVAAFGAVEQHGPHLPLLVDAEHGTRLAEATAARMGRTLVAPTVRVGCSSHHLAFPGSLSLRRSTLEAIAHDYCTSLAHHGFRKICLIPTHGGNFAPLAGVVDELDRQAGPACQVRAFTDLEALLRLWTGAVQREAGLGERVGGHADIAETALVLKLRPELVREERAEEGFTGTVDEELLERGFRDGFDTISPNGILGDARGGSAELGERILEEEAAFLAEHFAD
jgi:creatinine amidohydrolase